MLFRMSLASWYRVLNSWDCRESIFDHLKQATRARRTARCSFSMCRRRAHIHRLVLECVATSFARPLSDSVSHHQHRILGALRSIKILYHNQISLIIWYLLRIYMTTNYNLNYMMFEIYICILCYFVNLTINWYWRWPDCDRNIYDLYIINVNI